MVKSNKLRKILYSLFVVAIIGVIAYGVIFVYQNATASVSTFTSDGYALYLSPNSIKASTLPFKNGDIYAYKKRNNKVAFESNNENVSVDDDAIMHYQNGNLVVLKNTVGIDLNEISNDLILYYNIFKNTEIKKDSSNGYYIESIDKKIGFKKLLLRITDNKFLIAGDDVRAVLFKDQIVDFGNYLYFEYVNGDIKIDLSDKIISKNNAKRITLSNLVIDMDSNIDVITEEAQIDKGKIISPNVDKDILNPPITDDDEGTSNSGVINNGGIDGEDNGAIDNNDNNDIDNNTNNDNGNVDNNTDNNNIIDNNDDNNANSNDGENSGNKETEEENNTVYYKEPVFKVTSLTVTALKIDANIEITDDDGLLIDPVVFSIVENTTAATIYEEELRDGNLNAFISYPNLKPDTEYTLYAKASYKIEDITMEKTFVSKIFRTEALGVSFRKSYVTKDSIVLDLYKEDYSKVSSVTMGIYNEDSELIDYKILDLSNKNKKQYEVVFNELDHNKSYIVKMYDILSSGVVVDDGFSQVQTIKTLKVAPVIGDLSFRVNKADSSFELEVSKVTDADYGVVNYRYEVFDARQNISEDTPTLAIEQKNLANVNNCKDIFTLLHFL